MTSMEDSPNFFKRADYDERYWDDYLEARPYYDQPFYQSIYDYHKSHGGLNETAHDVGTGPGQVAAELSRHFRRVVASDNNDTHLAVAEHRLGPLTVSQRVTLVQCPAEDLTASNPASSVDLIAAAECLPLIDAEKAIQTFSTMLKPGGTLAIWFYGRPAFAEPEYARRCQPLLDSILDISFARIIKGGGPQQQRAFKRATDRMASFLDDVELSSGTWQDVERRKWNPECPMPFYGPDACNFEIVHSSKIGSDERVVEKRDPGFWERRWDLAGLRRFVRVILPIFDEKVLDPEVERIYEELGQMMGGKSASRKITWPVVLIVASKK